MNASGDWIASTTDLVRFTYTLDVSESDRILTPESTALMLARPSLPTWEGTDDCYGLGWRVPPG